ncbi:MAG: flagellar biosynthetic protein FliR [Desulfobacter sp.]|nr:flagellar biosynthetic protein FliR [Desulfobacter sp.]
MALLEWLRQIELGNIFFAITLGILRLFAIFTVAPFMAGGIVTGQLRIGIAFPIMFFIYPLLPDVDVMTAGMTNTESLFYLLAIMIKELFIGLCLGFLAGILFWVAQCAGFLMDNQRGRPRHRPMIPCPRKAPLPWALFYSRSLCSCFFPVLRSWDFCPCA